MRIYRNNWLKGNCPICGAVDKYGVNITTSRTNCFKCGYKKSPIRVIMEIEGITEYRNLLKMLEGVEGLAIKFELPEVKEVEFIELPESFMNIRFKKGAMSNMARNYLRGRGFKISTLSMKGFGYCSKGKYAGSIIIPFYYNNKLVYYSARRFVNTGEKFINPTWDEVGIGKSFVLYNWSALFIYQKVYLVESAFNAETIGDNSTALGGKKISTYQISQIIKSPVSEIIIILDPDAITEAIKLGLSLVNFKKVKVLKMPEGKDVNDTGKEYVFKLEKDSEYLSYGNLLKMQNNLNRSNYIIN